jgi:hypothetical protein
MSLPALWNTQIDKYYEDNKQYGGTYAKDTLPTLEDNSFYIVNLDNHNEMGSHWVLVSNLGTKFTSYVDPMGVPNIPKEIAIRMKKTGKSIVSNNLDVQELTSDSCGWFCIFIANHMLDESNTSPIAVIRKFLKFNSSENERMNEEILISYFHTHFGMLPNSPKLVNKRKRKQSGDGVDDENGTDLAGDGVKDVLKSIYNKVTGFFLNNPNPRFLDFIKKHGDVTITKLSIQRVPIQEQLLKAIDWLKKGEVAKHKSELQYDHLYHLYLVINDKYRVEKNHMVEAYGYRNVPDSESMQAILSEPIRIGDLFRNGERLQGSSYWRYNIVGNNCQVFATNTIKANKIVNKAALEKFAMQDAGYLLGGEDFRLTLVTDAAHAFDRFVRPRLGPTTRKVVDAVMAHPEITDTQLGSGLGIMKGRNSKRKRGIKRKPIKVVSYFSLINRK